MRQKLRKFIPNSLVNYSKHLPLALLASLRYGFPSRKMKVIGVTGTDGKTTTTNMIYQILKEAGKKVSMISTVNAVVGDQTFDTGFHVTTPDSFKLQSYIKRAKNSGSEYLVLEVTSFALDQFRVWGIKFDVGVITNVTHEHLDYHKSFENYLKAKAKLIKNARIAVLNKDDPNYEKLRKLTKAKVVSFGLHKSSDFNPVKFPLKLSIPGEFNIANALAASGVGVLLDIDTKTIKKVLENFKGLEGRMERVENDLGLKIFIDFAHTPNGLKNALTALKKSNPNGKLISIIGAEGYRDIGKRALMGEVATKLSDYVIISAVDPRGLIEQINAQILEGVKKAGGVFGKNIFVENDRQKAINLAILKLAKKGDSVGIFGKGHEKSMNLDGEVEIPWSDHKAVEVVLKNGK